VSPLVRRRAAILSLYAALLTVILFIGEAWMVPLLFASLAIHAVLGTNRVAAIALWMVLAVFAPVAFMCGDLHDWKDCWSWVDRRLWQDDDAQAARQAYTDEGARELSGEPEDYIVTWESALERMDPAVAALFTATPEKLVRQVWRGEITSTEMRDRIPLVTAKNGLTEKLAREILARHGRPYDGPIEFVDEGRTVVVGFDPFGPHREYGGFYNRQHQPIDATTYYR
jgi:hypothetical protein